MNSTELRDLLEAYFEVYRSQEIDEAMTAVASPAPGGRGRKNSYTKEIRTSAGSKTSPRYSKVKDADERMKTPLSKYDMPKMELKRGVRGVFEEFDTFNYLLEYLVAEGYADTNKAAIAIMSNMSEEWRESIVEEVLDEELTGSRAERAQEIMAAARPHGRRRASTDARYNAIKRVLKAKEGSIPPGRQPEHNIRGDEKLPTRRGGRGIKGRAKTYTDAGPTQSGHGNRATRRAGGTVDDTRYDESFDLFGTILEYLVAEGYADTNKAAIAIMSNMSEEWRSEIVEGIGTKLAAAGLAGIMGAGMMNAQNAVVARRQYPGGPVATDRTELVSKTDKKNKEPDQVELVKQRDAATEKKDKEERERMNREYQRIGGDAKAKKYGITSDNAEYMSQYHRGRK